MVYINSTTMEEWIHHVSGEYSTIYICHLRIFLNLTNFWIAILVLVFVTFALAGSRTISQYIAFSVNHSSIQEAKAIKHKTSFFVHPSNKGSTAHLLNPTMLFVLA